MKKSVRTNISIPSALKARMEAAGEDINWSAVAAQAFEAKLAEIITKRGAKDMNDVIARLKASKAKGDDKATVRGREAGRAWASNIAEAAELERLEAWTRSDSGTGLSWDEWLIAPGNENDAYGQDRRLAEAIRGKDLDRREGDDFWAYTIADDRASGPFLVGFVEGALAVWDQVKDEL